jgi:hypothetical protein
MSDHKPTLCLDFDGVIHAYTTPWGGADFIPDPPVPGALEFIIDAANNGFDVCIFSSRSGTPSGINGMKAWLFKHGCAQRQRNYPHEETQEEREAAVRAALLDRIRFPLNKPAAFVTLDDRAITFTGEFPAIEALKAFRPWNKPA